MQNAVIIELTKTIMVSCDINLCSVIVRLFTAIFLSSVIGFERASKRHSAGLRTFILVRLHYGPVR